jgi:hypothetical protein
MRLSQNQQKWRDLSTCGSRAASRPLSIVCALTPGYLEDLLSLHRIRGVIHRYAPRLQCISLEMNQFDIRELHLGLVPFPLLRCVAIGDYSEADSSEPAGIFTNAPQLCDLLLFTGTVFSSYELPTLQLTKFEGKIDNLDLFALAPNLVEARCSVAEWIIVPTSIISHLNLQFLAVSESEDDEPVDIFSHLTFPALQFLHIADPMTPALDTLESFLTRSSPPLRTSPSALHTTCSKIGTNAFLA